MNQTYGCLCRGSERGAFPGLAGWGIPADMWQEAGPYGPAASMDGHGTMPLVPAAAPPTLAYVPDPGIKPQVVPGVIKPPANTITSGSPQPPSSTIMSAQPPATITTVNSSGTNTRLAGVVGISAPVLGQRTYGHGMAAPSYGGLFTRDAAAQCAKFRGKLAEARQRGQQGLFGNKQGALQADVSRWCGKALDEDQAFAVADQLYAEALAAGDAATTSVIDAAVDQQLAADRTTGYYAAGAVGLAAIGLAFLVFGGGGR